MPDPMTAPKREGREPCDLCDGAGVLQFTMPIEDVAECPRCYGSGDRMEWSKCGACEGDGGNAAPCPECDGAGGWWTPWEPA